MKKIFSILLLLPIIILFWPAQPAQSQTAIEEVQAQRAKLETELAELEKEIAEKEAILSQQKEKSASLQGDINILKTEISKAKLKIKERNLTIEKLRGEIGEKERTIENLGSELERKKESLGQLIRNTREVDQSSSIVHIILSNESLSDFYSDVDAFTSIKGHIKRSVDEIREVRAINESEKEILQEKQNAEADAKAEIEKGKRNIEKKEEEKKKLLDVSEKKEKEYAEILAEREKKAAQIRSALFALRDTAAIPFGEALEYANLASQKTGVRPALILAILYQESQLGQYIGSCYLKDLKTGDGINSKTGAAVKKVMKPTRDVEPFLRITRNLGLDPYRTLVSCPWSTGYGGAMGPSQFIPSTWELFREKIAGAVGTSLPSPWEPRHAIMATAIYLGELGAAQGGFSAEQDAACRYYSGRSCSDPGVKNLFYGKAVMEKADDIQENMIDPLKNI